MFIAPDKVRDGGFDEPVVRFWYVQLVGAIVTVHISNIILMMSVGPAIKGQACMLSVSSKGTTWPVCKTTSVGKVQSRLQRSWILQDERN